MAEKKSPRSSGVVLLKRRPINAILADAKHPGAVLVMLLASLLSGNSVFPQERDSRPFVMDRFDAEAALQSEFFRTETRSRRSARTVIERSIFSQLFRFGLGGYSYDPRLLRYRLDMELENELLEGKYETPFASDIPRRTSTRGRRINYDLLVQLLPQRRESLSLWARRRDYRIDELLFDTFSIEQQAYGARFNTRWRVAPSSIQIETRDTTERGLFDTTRERADNLLYQMRKQLGDNSRLDIDYEYLRRRRLTTGRFRSPRRLEEVENTHRAEVHHEYRFGPQDRSSLNSQLSYLDQAGTFPFRNLLARERLLLYHSPTLQTDYGLSYNESETAGRSVRTAEAQAGLRHRLYENLITRLEARFRHTDETDFSWNEVDLLGHWSYTRHTPWGRLLLSYLVHNTNQGSGSRAGAANELTNYFELAHEFRNRFRLFYRLEDQRLNADSPVSLAITESRTHTVGYELPWRQWAWLQEYRTLRDTLGQTDSLRSELRGTVSLPGRSNLNLRLGHEAIDYNGRLEKTRLLTGQMDYFLPFGRTGTFELEALYSDQLGIVDEREWRLRSGLEWRWRKLKVRFTGQYGLFENRRSGLAREGVHLLFTISRKF